MTTAPGATLPRDERLRGRSATASLFAQKGGQGVSAFPLRAVWKLQQPNHPSQMMISVPKRHFKHAVKRNRLKRLVREAYRRHKHLLDDTPVMVAFLWTAQTMLTAQEVEQRMVQLLHKLAEKALRAQEKSMATPQQQTQLKVQTFPAQEGE